MDNEKLDDILNAAVQQMQKQPLTDLQRQVLEEFPAWFAAKTEEWILEAVIERRRVMFAANKDE